ncbi:MAG: hypothetical protein WCP19_07970 [Chloroflexota bacterium]
MKNITTPLILIVIYLAIVFNFETVTITNSVELKIHSYLDLLIMVMIVFSMLFSLFSKLPGYANLAFWLTVYFAVWIIVPKDPSPQITLTVTIVEVLCVSIGALLVSEFIHRLVEMDKTLQDLIYSSFTGRTIKMEEAEFEIKNELLRSRRYQHQMTILVVKPNPESIDLLAKKSEKEINHTIARKYTLGKISEVLNATSRRPDLVIKQEGNDNFIIIAPETSGEKSALLNDRVRDAIKKNLDITVEIGTATFPEDALTFDELLRKASTNLLIPEEQIPNVSSIN